MWVGSISLCGELADPYTNSEIPPFEVGFFAAKVRININEMLTPVVSTRLHFVNTLLKKSVKGKVDVVTRVSSS